MERRAITGLVLAVGAFLAASPASAQQADAGALNPAESSCVAQSMGSACDSSNATGAGGTCLAGCCCHYVNDPEGTTVCAACLACSDTGYLDPAFKSGACSDGGTLAPGEDAGVVPLVDSGPPVGSSGPPPSDTSSSGCSMIAAPRSAAPSGLVLFFAALGSIAAMTMRRKRR